jgi:hypothetical protein
MITPVSGDQADKSEAPFLEMTYFGPIKTVILSPESTLENVLQETHKKFLFCFAAKHEYVSNDLRLTVRDSFTNLSVVNFCIIMSSYQLTNAFSSLITLYICT